MPSGHNDTAIEGVNLSIDGDGSPGHLIVRMEVSKDVRRTITFNVSANGGVGYEDNTGTGTNGEHWETKAHGELSREQASALMGAARTLLAHHMPDKDTADFVRHNLRPLAKQTFTHADTSTVTR